MYYIFKCLTCRNEIQAQYQYIGDLVKCPICNSMQIVPDPILMINAEYYGYVIDDIYSSNHLWVTYKATGRTELPGQKVFVCIPSSFFIRNCSDFNIFSDTAIRCGSLNIPEIPALVDRCLVQGKVYFVYEMLKDAKTLSGFVGSKVLLNCYESLLIIRKVAFALKKAWDKERILHNNLKPTNIRLGENGDVRIIETGISTVVSKDSALLQKGFNIWDYRYMSPEFITDGKNEDPRSDIYSLGGIFYMLLTGKHPYESMPMKESLAAPIPDPRQQNFEIPTTYFPLLSLMMAKNINERFASWDDVLGNIDNIVNTASALRENYKAKYQEAARINLAPISTGRYEPSGQAVGEFENNADIPAGKISRGKYEITDTIAKIVRQEIAGINKRWKRTESIPAFRSKPVKTDDDFTSIYFLIIVLIISFLIAVFIIVLWEQKKKNIRKSQVNITLVNSGIRENASILSPEKTPFL